MKNSVFSKLKVMEPESVGTLPVTRDTDEPEPIWILVNSVAGLE